MHSCHSKIRQKNKRKQLASKEEKAGNKKGKQISRMQSSRYPLKIDGKVVLPFISQVAFFRFGQHFKLLKLFLQDHRLSGQCFQSRFIRWIFGDEAVTQMLG
jgi:hypothetical protein